MNRTQSFNFIQRMVMNIDAFGLTLEEDKLTLKKQVELYDSMPSKQ